MLQSCLLFRQCCFDIVASASLLVWTGNYQTRIRSVQELGSWKSPYPIDVVYRLYNILHCDHLTWRRLSCRDRLSRCREILSRCWITCRRGDVSADWLKALFLSKVRCWKTTMTKTKTTICRPSTARILAFVIAIISRYEIKAPTKRSVRLSCATFIYHLR